MKKQLTWKTFQKYCKLKYDSPPLCKNLVAKSKSRKEYESICRCREENCPPWKRLERGLFY